MPTISRRGLLQAGLVLLALAAAPSGLVEARRRRSKQAADTTGDDKAATQQYDELPPATPPQWKGKIGMRKNESTPFWPKAMTAPEGAPNVLMILIDDAGFGSTSAFGGPIPTPTFEALANRGLRYTAFHTTALCSPTRAALLTGRNHHSVHTGTITETASGFPGYDTLMGKDTASVGEILKQRGWNTLWSGKNHNVPDWQSSQTGPFDLWPNNLGFEHFYGFIGGDTSQWRPALFEGNKPIEPYLDNPDYNLNEDLADYNIRYIEQHAALNPDKPWMLYYAPGATHAPHHVSDEWIAKFKGKFDHGWDKQREMTFVKQKEMGIFPANATLTARPKEIPAWDETPEDERKFYARFMEVYAAFMAQTDYEIGRVINRIKELGQEDNTLVILMIGDNGASGEGSLQGLANEMVFFNNVEQDFSQINIDEIGSQATYNHYPVGWAHAMNTPFQWVKQVASHYGGVRNPMIISWPKRIKEDVHGQLRQQWHHVIDVAPTILEAVDVKPPSKVNGVEQRPIEGVSMVYTFDAKPEDDSKRETQYFEMLGNRGIYNKGWTAGTTPVSLPWSAAEIEVDPIDGYEWELYNVNEDPTQSKNIAKDNPGKLQELKDLFNREGEKYNVFPIDNSRSSRLDVSTRPSLMRGRNQITFYQGMIRTPEGAAPDFKNKDFNLTADVNLPTGAENGVLATIGGRYSGWSFYLKDGYLKYAYNLAGVKITEIKSDYAIPAGDHKLDFKFDYDGNGVGRGGMGTLFVDGQQVGQGRIDRTLCCRISLDETFDVGADTGTSANPADYDVPNKFKGKMKGLTIGI